MKFEKQGVNVLKLTSVPVIVQAISQMFPEKVSIAIADQSKYIYYQPSDIIDLKIKPGDALKQGTVSLQALHEKKKVAQYVEGDVFGVPYFGLSIPLMEHGAPEGCVTAIFPKALPWEDTKLPKHRFLMGKREDIWVPLPFHLITYVSAADGKTWLHTEEAMYQNKYSLTELQTILPQDQFVRCHRSFFVNVNEIAEIQPDFHSTFTLVMKDKAKSRIPVSQTYASLFRYRLGF
ncbi:MAG: LytTR family DNA-binding domain-containing protein [Clostridia bacterium]